MTQGNTPHGGGTASRIASIFRRYSPLLVLGALWEIFARSGIVPQNELPSLSEVLSYWGRLAAGGDILTYTGSTLARLALGLSASIVVGIALGLSMARWNPAEKALSPLLTMFYPIPQPALIPVLIIWLGIGSPSKVAVIFLGCLLPIVMASFHAARGVDRFLIWSAWNAGAGERSILLRVVLPAALPDILIGIRTALALSFILAIAAEMLSGDSGLGHLITTLGDGGIYSGMFAAVLTVAAVGFLADRLYLMLVARLTEWQER